jgi:hypothetical protein
MADLGGFLTDANHVAGFDRDGWSTASEIV